MALAFMERSEHSICMPRWAWGLIIVLILIIWIIPNPAGAGTTVGNAFDAIVTFFRSIGSAAGS
jgi:hypothetical protein